MKFILISLFSSLGIAFLISIIETSRKRRRLVDYAGKVEPIIEKTRHPNDNKVLQRCQEHLQYLELSGNKIYRHIVEQPDNRRKLNIRWAENENRVMWLDFVLPVIFRDHYPNETWEEYEARFETTRRLYLEAYHAWIREIGTRLDNNEWYVAKILAQEGASTVKHYLTFQK